MNENLKRYVISSGITFASTFLLALGSSIHSLDPNVAISGSVIVGFLSVALRAGIKSVTEALVSYYTKES